MSTDIVGIALLSTLAGLGTGLGGLAVLVRKPGEKLLVFLIGLAAGLMIMLSFMELLFDSLIISGFSNSGIYWRFTYTILFGLHFASQTYSK